MERVRPSATVLLVRAQPELRVFLVERSRRTRFFPGYHAFPGGVLDEADGGDFLRGAAREVEEETGLRLDPSRLVDAGRLLTPPFGPLRYDTRFFVCLLREGEEPRVDGQELVSGAWWRPDEALARWERDAMPIPPPTLAYLRLLALHGDAVRAAEAARTTDGRPHHERFRIELHPGVYALPLRTPTLPPATTTTCYLFDGDPIVVVDPGSADAKENVALFHTLDEMTRDGRQGLVVLTHHHHDHVGGAEAVRQRYRFHVAAHAETRSRLPQGLVDRALAEGETLDLGVWGARPWRLEVLHTPGHASGHVALRDARWGAIVAGDLVSGVSTILVDPGEGDLGQYLASLARCACLKPPLVLPAHGPALPGSAFQQTLDHRRMREAKTLAALGAEPRTVEDLLPKVYDDTPREAWGLAARSLDSILAWLEQQGKARRVGGGWVLSSSSPSPA